MGQQDTQTSTSNYITFSNHARMLIANYGSSSRTDERVFVKRRDGELELILNLGDEESADRELQSINQQLDRWEVAQQASRKPNRR